MTTKEMIEVMKAYEEGKKIQAKEIGGNGDWYDCEPVWNWYDCEYRIKPENPVRPFTFEEATNLLGHSIVKIDTRLGITAKLITAVREETNGAVQINGLPALTLAREWVFLDNGKPCGVVEEQK